jgi:hypothetical protein
MKRIKLSGLDIGILIMIVVGIAGAIIAERQLSAQEQECEITAPTEQDFAEATGDGDGNGIFDPELWRLEYMEHEGLISVNWSREDEAAFAHSQYLLYNCGYNDDELDTFYGDENIDVMLGGYDTWEETARCSEEDVELREYTLMLDGDEYISRLWIEPISDTRVRDMRLDFPVDEGNEMDEYARRLYPQLVTCVR